MFELFSKKQYGKRDIFVYGCLACKKRRDSPFSERGRRKETAQSVGESRS